MLTPLAVSTQIRPPHAFQFTYHRPQEAPADPSSAILCSGNSLGLPTTITTAFSCYASVFFFPMTLSKDLYFIQRDSTTANWEFKLKYKIYHQSMDRNFNFMAALTIRSDFGA